MTKLAVSKATFVILVLAFGASAHAEDSRLPEIPEFAPNPFKKTVTAPVNLKDNIKLLEQTLYGSLNADKPDDLRIIGLERTVFGVSYPKAKLSLAARTAGLEKVVDRLLAGRKCFEEKRWTEAKTELNEVLKLLGSSYKSLVRAEVHYRIGMCDYELSNVGQSTPGVKVNGLMIRTSRENLSKAQDYYKSLGDIDTAQKITAFMDSFKDQSEKSFLY